MSTAWIQKLSLVTVAPSRWPPVDVLTAAMVTRSYVTSLPFSVSVDRTSVTQKRMTFVPAPMSRYPLATVNHTYDRFLCHLQCYIYLQIIYYMFQKVPLFFNSSARHLRFGAQRRKEICCRVYSLLRLKLFKTTVPYEIRKSYSSSLQQYDDFRDVTDLMQSRDKLCQSNCSKWPPCARTQVSSFVRHWYCTPVADIQLARFPGCKSLLWVCVFSYAVLRALLSWQVTKPRSLYISTSIKRTGL